VPEPNGSGRLDRVELILDKIGERMDKLFTMGYLHDERLARIEANFERMQELSQQSDRRIAALSEQTDKRVADLVAAIGKLIERMPAADVR
jgi:hypothetical protein